MYEEKNNCSEQSCCSTFPLSLESKVDDIKLNIYNPNTDTTEEKTLSDYAGKWLILFFYPADFTFVCPTELKDLNKSYKEIQDNNGELLVVSVDTVFSHKRWIETEKLLENFGIPMVSDRTAELSTIFDVLNQESGNSERGTFIISPDGIVKSVEIVTEPVGRSSAELVRKLKALEFVRNNPGLACPASWNTGEKTLEPSIKIAGKVQESLD